MKRNAPSLKSVLFFTILIAAIPMAAAYFNPAHADVLTPSRNTQGASFQFGLDGAPLIDLGYLSKPLYAGVQLDLGLGIPTGQMFNDPWAGRYSAMTRWAAYETGPWKLFNRGGLRAYGHESLMWSGLAVNLEERVEGGYYSGNWYAALELGVRPLVSTYVKHSDSALDNNPDLKSGWYGKGLSGLYLIGLSGAYSIGPVDIGMRLLYTIPIESSINPYQRSVADAVIDIGVMYRIDGEARASQEVAQ